MTVEVIIFSLLHSQYYSTTSGKDIVQLLFLFNVPLLSHLYRTSLLKGLQILQCTNPTMYQCTKLLHPVS